MKIEKFKHTGVNPDGTFKNKAGSVETAGIISMSDENGGCGIPLCKCSPGHWVTIVMPRSKGGIVEGVKVQFENRDEMDGFLKYRRLICKAKK